MGIPWCKTACLLQLYHLSRWPAALDPVSGKEWPSDNMLVAFIGGMEDLGHGSVITSEVAESVERVHRDAHSHISNNEHHHLHPNSSFGEPPIYPRIRRTIIRHVSVLAFAGR